MTIGVFGGFILVVYIIAKYNYLIKKAMIEKGSTNDSSTTKLRYIDLGCIVLGLGLGLIVASYFTTIQLTEDTADLLIWGTILIFGALGLLLAHFIRRKIEK